MQNRGVVYLEFEVSLFENETSMAEFMTIEQRINLFCEQYYQTRSKYVRFAFRFVRDRDVVEDLVNESFVNFWANKQSLAHVSNLESYFYTIVKNNCRDWIRSKQTRLEIQKNIHDSNYRLLQYDLNALDTYDPNLIHTEEIRTIVMQELNKLPKLKQDIFIESRFNDMTYEEISVKFGISIRMVTRAIQSVLATLRLSLRDYLLFIWLLLHLSVASVL